MRKTWFLVGTLLVLVSLATTKARADVNDFVINDFHGRYELNNDVRGGRMNVTESIELTFSDQNHGILRAIPTDYKGSSLQLEVRSVSRDGQTEPYTTYGQSGNEVLKIGDADKTVTGSHTYEIQYTMRNIIAFYDDYDEWYWDVNGDQWGQPFENVTAEVVLPDDWELPESQEASCFTGSFGSTESACRPERTAPGYSFTASEPLGPGQTLTVVLPVSKGVFAPRTRADWFRDNALQLAGLASGAAFSFVIYRQWRRWGRDYTGRGIVVPEYEPPKGLSPAEVGLLYDYRVDSRDLTATIIDLALRGYVRIHDEEKKRFGLFTSHKFSLELTKDTLNKLKQHEKKLLEAIFKDIKVGEKQELAKISKPKMQKAAKDIRSNLRTALTEQHGLLEETPVKAWVILIGLSVVAFLGVIFSGGGRGWLAGAGLTVISAVVFGLLMRRRSHAGTAEYEKTKGLKLYMDTAEKHRLKMMQSVERPYAEPSHTVEFFEKLLPFAVALGVEKSWARQFDDIYKDSPDWFAGNAAAFGTVHFASHLSGGISSLNSSFSQSTASSGSGSGGGGFSGGGGGGGGGGGW